MPVDFINPRTAWLPGELGEVSDGAGPGANLLRHRSRPGADGVPPAHGQAEQDQLGMCSSPQQGQCISEGSFMCRASHYARRGSPGRKYLPSDLSVARMH